MTLEGTQDRFGTALVYLKLCMKMLTNFLIKVTNPASELKKLQDFLGLNTVITREHFYFNSTKGFPCLKKREASGVPHCLGEGKGRAHPVVSPYAKAALYDFYRPYNFELYKLTGVDFKWEERKPVIPNKLT